MGTGLGIGVSPSLGCATKNPVKVAVETIRSYSWFALYDFRDLGYADGALINAAVPDISGNGRNLTTTSSTTQPTYRATGFNGFGCAEFITNDHLRWQGGGTFNASSGLIVYMACRFKAAPADFARPFALRTNTGNQEVLISHRSFAPSTDLMIWYGTPTPLERNPRPTIQLVYEHRNRHGNVQPNRIRMSDGYSGTSVNNVDRTISVFDNITIGKNPNLSQPANLEVAWFGVISEGVLDTQTKRDEVFDAFKVASGVA
jgi:hypothetical protein